MWQKRLASFLLIIVLVASAGYLWRSSANRRQEVTILALFGTAEHTNQDGQRMPIEHEPVLSIGDTVRTGSFSEVSLRIGVGGKVTLGPNTTLSLIAVSPGVDEVVHIHLELGNGGMSFELTPPDENLPRFSVQTFSSTAWSESESFSVLVSKGRGTLYIVDEGTLLVKAAGEEVGLMAGQGTWVEIGSPPHPPAFTFSAAGPVSEGPSGVWTVGGAQVHFPNDLVRADFQGKPIRLAGRILSNGNWAVDWIGETVKGEEEISFTGPLLALDAENWRVGSKLVVVGDVTEVLGSPALGEILKVSILPEFSGPIQARQISGLGETLPTDFLESPSPQPFVQDLGLSFKTEEIIYEGCDLSPSFIGFVGNSGGQTTGAANNIGLGYVVTTGETFLENISFDPGSWDIIPFGEEVSFRIHLGLKETWKTAAPRTEMTIKIILPGGFADAGDMPGSLTLTLIQACQ
jgi:hypothetical protein